MKNRFMLLVVGALLMAGFGCERMDSHYPEVGSLTTRPITTVKAIPVISEAVRQYNVLMEEHARVHKNANVPVAQGDSNNARKLRRYRESAIVYDEFIVGILQEHYELLFPKEKTQVPAPQGFVHDLLRSANLEIFNHQPRAAWEEEYRNTLRARRLIR